METRLLIYRLVAASRCEECRILNINGSLLGAIRRVAGIVRVYDGNGSLLASVRRVGSEVVVTGAGGAIIDRLRISRRCKV